MVDRKTFTDSVTPLPDQGITKYGLTVNAALPDHRNDNMSLVFSLSIPNDKQEELEAKVARGETVSPETLNKQYALSKSESKKLTDWLKGQGFQVTGVSSDNTSVYATASVTQIEKTLQVKMVSVTKDGLSYTAAQNAPSLPTDVAASVRAIIGLQPFRHAHKHFRLCPPTRDNRLDLSSHIKARSQSAAGKTAARKAKSVTAPAPNVSNAPPYLVSEIKTAYGAAGVPFDGKGQTIAILIDTVPSDVDLKLFWKRNGLPTTIKQIAKINVKGGALPPAEGEETLDAEWASGVAPAANIRIYAAGSLEFVDLDRALDRILADVPTQPAMRQLSISLGLGETYFGGLGGEVAAQHQKFLKLAAVGVNVFVSSGDAGSNPDNTGHNSSGPLQAEYEASDPCVVAVGGTSLMLNAAGQVSSERGWVGSGGGKSTYFPKPIWQQRNGVPADNARCVPDISAAADPNTGALIVLNGQVRQIGGTSWSAPTWAGFCALINQARQAAGKPSLPFLNPQLYQLGPACFRDITEGNNGEYNVQPGYDMVTGLGTPNIEQMIAALT